LPKTNKRAELYLKLNSWVNKLGGDRAFANNIAEVPKTVRQLVYSDPELMERFGFAQTHSNE